MNQYLTYSYVPKQGQPCEKRCDECILRTNCANYRRVLAERAKQKPKEKK